MTSLNACPDDEGIDARAPDFTWRSDEDAASESVGIYGIEMVGDVVYVAGGNERILMLRRTEEEKLEQVESLHPKVHTDTITRLSLSPDNTLLAAAGLDGRLSVYKCAGTGLSHLKTFESGSDEFEDLSWAPKGLVLLAACRDSTVVVHRVDRQYDKCLTGHEAAVTCCRWLSVEEGLRVITADESGVAIVWDPISGDSLAKVRLQGAILTMDTHPTEPVVVVGCASGAVALINVARGVVVQEDILFKNQVEAVAFSPLTSRDAVGDMMIAGADSDGNILVMPMSSLKRSRSRITSESSVSCLAWFDEKTFVTAGADGLARLWDARDGSLKDTLFIGGLMATCLKVVGQDIAVGCEDGQVCVFHL